MAEVQKTAKFCPLIKKRCLTTACMWWRTAIYTPYQPPEFKGKRKTEDRGNCIVFFMETGV